MPDLLIKLYTLPPLEPEIAQQAARGITLRRAIAPERHHVAAWVEANFSPFWRSECEVAFGYAPITCTLAIQDKRLIGFACYDTTMKGFFGPTGVSEAARGQGTGRALLIACLHAMYGAGYAYAIVGAAGPVEFYRRAVGAVVIEDSTPGIYAGLLRTSE